MELFIDGEKFGSISEEQLQQYQDIYELKQQLQLICEEKQRVICQMKIDGDELTLLGEEDFRLNNLDLIERMDVKTANPRELALESLESMPVVMDQHKVFFLRAVEYFEHSQEDECREEFMKGLGGLVWLNVVVRSIHEVLKIPLNTVFFRGEDMLTKFQQFQKSLAELEVQAENGDFSRITTHLKERIIPQMRYWENVSPVVLKRIRGE